MMMKTLATPSTEAASDIQFPTSVAPLSADDVATTDRLLATLQALSTKASTPKDPAIAALLQSLNVSTKFRQRANGNRRARRSIRIKRMYPKSHVCTQKHAQGFGRKQTQTDSPPHHPHHPHHPASKVLRSHAAQTAIDRYRRADSLIEGIQPTFTPISATLPTGSAPTDLSMGWDGSLWAIDQHGAPYIYDPINNEWNVHGEGIDAAAAIGNTLYLFRGNQYVTVTVMGDGSTPQTSAPMPITTLFTNSDAPMPRSFQLGVTGAAAVGNTLYLFFGGWYLPVDGSQPRAKLTDIPGWPTTPNWSDGVIDAVYLIGDPTQVRLRRGNEALDLAFDGQEFQIVDGPNPLSSWQTSITAGAVAAVGDDLCFFFYSGVQVQMNQNSQQYLPALHQNWPVTWNPILAQAPSGRMGNLWVATTAGDTIQHNGETWSSIETPTGFQGAVNSVSVGICGSVWVANGQALASWNGSSWTQHPQNVTKINQVSVGISTENASQVWVRDGDNNVLQYDSQSLSYTANTQVGQATHIGANNDGTLWHCNDSNNTPNANIYRLVSESTAASEPLAIDETVTRVRRVATTGFGSSHCLIQHSDGSQGIYRYDSPYVFKTSNSYWGAGLMALGLGRIYMKNILSEGSGMSWSGQIVALDLHTGQEVAYSPVADKLPYVYNSPVLDLKRELIYVTTTKTPEVVNDPTGRLLAFDANTLHQQWSYPTPNYIPAPPAVNGNYLCFGDSGGNLYLFDTRTFTSSAAPHPLWTHQLTGGVDATPAIVGNRIYVSYSDSNGLSLKIFDVTTGNVLPQTAPTPLGAGGGAGFNASIIVNHATSADADIEVFIPHDYGVCIVHPFATPPQVRSFSLPAGVGITALTYDDGSRVGKPAVQRSLWFGDYVGNLWSVDPDTGAGTSSRPIENQGTGILSQPALYKDTDGGMTVCVGVLDGPADQSSNLWLYDPDPGTGQQNWANLPTGATAIGALSTLAPADNGILYAAGGIASDSDNPSVISQVFAMRVDVLVQALRDFIIESQLMQDPDESAANGNIDPKNPPTNPIPPSVNRYQTHLTVVDNNKTPRANEPLKIWADKRADNTSTVITLGGFSGTPSGPSGSLNPKTNTYTCSIGPDDGAFVSVQTGADGSLTIVSDATDMFATPLRVWASFMNSYERIVVNPDQEFHQRVTTAHADATDTDPDKVNLATTTNYSGTPLFSQDEVNAGQPGNAAQAVGQMKQGINLGGTNTSTRLTYSRLMQGARLAPHSTAGEQLAATSQSYVAYPDLHGMGYFATNVPSQRPVTPVQSVGFKFSAPNKLNPGSSIQVMTHADALNEIDGFTGDPWEKPVGSTDLPFQTRRLGNWWTDFWSWLTNAVDNIVKEILSIVTAIGDAVTVGIQMLVKGIETVFHCRIQFLEDIASAIGSFFNMLEKVLSDVLEALSILFHFGEIIKTQQWIENYLVNQIRGLVKPTNSNDPNSDIIHANVIPAVTNFFNQGKDEIKKLFGSAQSVAPTNSISQQQGVGSTTHTAYSVGPQGSNTTSSHAVQCNWGTQKMNAGVPVATGSSSSSSALVGDDPVTAFFNDFIQKLGSDFSSDFSQFSSSSNSTFQSTSASEFFQNALNSFLGLIEGLILLVVDIASDLTTGLLEIFDDVITLLFGTGDPENPGILNQTITIPVLSWLYNIITGEDLTFLNLITLVLAFPATIIFRVVQGVYPSAANLPSGASVAKTDTPALKAEVGDESKILQWMLMLIGVTLGVAGGVFSSFGDSSTEAEDESYPTLAKLYVVVSLLSIPLALPTISNPTPGLGDWSSFALSVALGLLSVLGVITVSQAWSTGYGVLQAFLLAILSIGSMAISFINFYQNKNNGDWDKVALSIAFFSVVAGCINPIKYLGVVPKAVVLILDVTGPTVAAVLSFVSVYFGP